MLRSTVCVEQALLFKTGSVHAGVVCLHRTCVYEVKHLGGGARHAALFPGEILCLFLLPSPASAFTSSLCFHSNADTFSLTYALHLGTLIPSLTSCKAAGE